MNNKTDIIQNVCICESFVMMLGGSGAVTVTGTDRFTEEIAPEWRNVIKLCGGRDHVIGLRADGTLASFGDDSFGQCQIQGLKGIKDVFASGDVTAVIDENEKLTVIGRYPAAASENHGDEEKYYENEAESEKFNYSVENGAVTLNGYNCEEKQVCVPCRIGGRPVDKIADEAFKGRNDIETVRFYNDLRTIGRSAFWGCSGLRRLYLGHKGLESIGDSAFWQCTSLEELELDGNGLKIGQNAFRGCASLKSVRLGDGVSVISNNAFARCTGLERIIIPDSIKTIGDSAFYKCDKLVICGGKDSFAEKYAASHGIGFEVCQSEITETEVPEANDALSEIKKLSPESFLEMNKVCMDDIERRFPTGDNGYSGQIRFIGIYYMVSQGRSLFSLSESVRRVYMLYDVEVQAAPDKEGKSFRPLKYCTSFCFPLVSEENDRIRVDTCEKKVCSVTNYTHPYFYYGYYDFNDMIGCLDQECFDKRLKTSVCLAKSPGYEYDTEGTRVSTKAIDLSELLDALEVKTGNDVLDCFFGEISMAEKENDGSLYEEFQKMLKSIDDMVSSMKNSLRYIGINDENLIETLSEEKRYEWEAEAVKSLTSPGTFGVCTPDYKKILSDYEAGVYDGIGLFKKPPISLEKTKQGFEDRIIDGISMTLYNDPEETNKKLIKKQGLSVFPMRGTCGICQSGNLATLAGIGRVTEARAISAALHCSQTVFDDIELKAHCMSDRGGTTSQDRQEILDRLGCPNTLMVVKYQKSKTVAELAEIIRSGRVVIVSVDAGRLWKIGHGGGHAISLISVTGDGSKFVYNDTGAGVMKAITADELSKCLIPARINVTKNIVR